MSALLVALALAMAEPASAASLTQAAPEVAVEAAAELPFPAGAPKDDYQLVAWCYGALEGYVSLHDQVMPEVTRIESTYRRPGATLAGDMKVYADLQKTSRINLKLFTRTMEAAERASMRPINAEGAGAIKAGQRTWAGADNVSKARLAQEWMGWTLPARCIPTAEALEKRAKLAGPALRANEPVEPAAEPALEPAPEPAAEAIPTNSGPM